MFATVVLVLLILLIGAEKNIFDCEEEALLWHGRDGEETRSSSLFVRVFSAQSDTESSGEDLSDLEGTGFYILAKAVTTDSRISTWTYSMSFSRRVAQANSNFEATLSREGARLDSNPDNNGSSRLINYPDADCVDARAGHLLFHQKVCMATSNLPSQTSQRACPQTRRNSGLNVGFHTGRHDPNVVTGTSNEAGLRGKAIASVLSFLGMKGAFGNQDCVGETVIVGSQSKKVVVVLVSRSQTNKCVPTRTGCASRRCRAS